MSNVIEDVVIVILSFGFDTDNCDLKGLNLGPLINGFATVTIEVLQSGE